MNSKIYMVFSVLFIASHVLAKPKEQSKAALACEVLFNPENIDKRCCTSVDQYIGYSEECKGSSSEEYTCDKAICSLKKIDVLDVKNEVDEKKYEDYLMKIEKENPKEKATIDIIKKQCLGDKYKKYPAAESSCLPMKLHICAFLHSTVECTSWKSDDGCGELATSAGDCKPFMYEILEQMTQ